MRFETFLLWMLGLMLLPMAHDFFPRIMHDPRFAAITGYGLGGLVAWALAHRTKEKP